jgi:hypothetical protein
MASDPQRPFIRRGSAHPGIVSRPPTTAELVAANRGPGFVAIAARTLLGLLALLLVLFLLFLLATAIEGNGPKPTAPWATSAAPAVTPAPLGAQ